MKIAFKIPPQTEAYSSLHLLVEAGNDEVSFLLFEKDPCIAHGFYTFNFDKHLNFTELSSGVAEIFSGEGILSKAFASVNVFYNFREVTLVPDPYFVYGQDEAVCELMFGTENRARAMHDEAKTLGARVIYRVPEKVHTMIGQQFAGTTYRHSLSLIKSADSNAIDCVVYHSTIRVCVWKAGKLQVLQYFDYTAPADVVFYLLNCCAQFGLDPQEIELTLSGMIAESSVLYEEVYKYFSSIVLKVPSGVALSEKLAEHPAHFYTHLTDLAQCV